MFTPTRAICSLLLLVLLQPILRADSPKFRYPLLQLMEQAQAITETDLSVYTRAFADGKTVNISENSIFLKGINTTYVQDKSDEVKDLLMQESTHPDFNPLGAKVYQFHLRYNKHNSLIKNDIIIVSGHQVSAFRERLIEAIPLVEKERAAQLWRWVIAGLSHDNELIENDAFTTVYYTMKEDKYLFDHYENRPLAYINKCSGLDIRGFPKDQKEVFINFIQNKGLTGSVFIPFHSLMSLGYELEIPRFNEICLRYAALNLAEAKTTGQDNAYLHTAQTLARMALEHPASTNEQRQHAARLLIFAQRWQIHHHTIEKQPVLAHAEYKNYIPSLADYLGGNDLKEYGSNLVQYIQPYNMGIRNVSVKEMEEAALAFNRLAASRIDMCSDPVIEQLTGNFNWWDCHKLETQQTQVLANAQQSTTAATPLNIVIAPNPVREGHFTAGWQLESEATNATLRLLDVSGRLVWEQKHTLTRYTNMQQVEISLPPSVSAGIYTFSVQYPDRQLDTKVIVE